MARAGDGSRIGRALALLRVDHDASVQTLADVLYLASKLPVEAVEPLAPLVVPTGDPGKVDVNDSSGTQANSSKSGVKELPPLVDVFPALMPRPNEEVMPATLITVPAADALPGRLALERALKPFLKRILSHSRTELNVDATAEASADRRAITPIFEPVGERWFDVLLLVEQSDAMEMWAETVRELHTLLARHGAFRTVRTVRFMEQDDVLRLTSGGQPLAPRAAFEPDGRLLCLLLTHGTGEEWQREALPGFLQALGRRGVVAILQMLPQGLWENTALGGASERLQNATPGAVNAALACENPFSGDFVRDPNVLYAPMLPLEPASLARWARFVVSPSRTDFAGTALAVRPSPAGTQVPAASLEARLRAFRKLAPGAFQLLRLLSSVPLTLPIMRLVQQSRGAAADPFHLAAVMLSGFIERVTPRDSTLPGDEVQYDFIAGAGELLRETLSLEEAESIDTLMKPVQERIRVLVEDLSPHSAAGTFSLLLSDPEGTAHLPQSAKTFIEVSRRIYEERGLLKPGPRNKSTIHAAGEQELRGASDEPAPEDRTPDVLPPNEMRSDVILSDNIQSDDTGQPVEPEDEKYERPVWPLARPLTGLYILWVDDKVNRNQEVAGTLRKLGARISFAVSSAQALQAIEVGYPVFRLVITDMSRPESKRAGLSLMKSLSARDPSLPMILYTSHRWKTKENLVQQMHAAGGRAFTDEPEALLEEVLKAAATSATLRFSARMHEIVRGRVEAFTLFHQRQDRVARQLAALRPARPYAAVAALAAITDCGCVQLFFGKMHLRLEGEAVAEGHGSYEGATPGGVVEQAHRTNKTIYLSNVTSGEYGDRPESTGCRLAVPLRATDGAAIGVLTFESKQPQAFDQQQIIWLEDFCRSYPWVLPAARVRLLHSPRDIRFANDLTGRLQAAGLYVLSIADVALTLTPTYFKDSNFDCLIPLLSRASEDDPDFQRELDADLEAARSAPYPVYVVSVLLDVRQPPVNLRQFSWVSFRQESWQGIEEMISTIKRFDVQKYDTQVPLTAPSASSQTVETPERSAFQPAVLVVGTGTYDLPIEVQQAAIEVGRAVSKLRGKLITGGWPGVDYLASEAFVAGYREQDVIVGDELMQFVDRNAVATYQGGKIFRIVGRRSEAAALDAADAVILIGGAGGTWNAFRQCLAAGKPVFPLLNTGTDAYRAGVLMDLLMSPRSTTVIRSQFDKQAHSWGFYRDIQVALENIERNPSANLSLTVDVRWMVEDVLPQAQNYLRKESGYDKEALRIVDQFRRHSLAFGGYDKLLSALVQDADPAWRCTGYLGMEAHPHETFANVLPVALDIETVLGLESGETRPLWRCLSAIGKLGSRAKSTVFYPILLRLEETSRQLQSHTEVDRGGECKRLLQHLLDDPRFSPPRMA